MIHAPPALLREEDYDAIEAAVMETARGRWFLAEFARRNRNADTDAVIGAIERLERALAPRPAELSADLAGMRAALEAIRSELLVAGRLPPAPEMPAALQPAVVDSAPIPPPPRASQPEIQLPTVSASPESPRQSDREPAEWQRRLLLPPSPPPVEAEDIAEADSVTVRVDFAELSFAERAALFS